MPTPKKPAEANPETPNVITPDGDDFHSALMPKDSCISVSGALISVSRMGMSETDNRIDANKNKLTPAGLSTTKRPCPIASPPQTTTIWIENSCPRFSLDEMELSHPSTIIIMPATQKPDRNLEINQTGGSINNICINIAVEAIDAYAA